MKQNLQKVNAVDNFDFYNSDSEVEVTRVIVADLSQKAAKDHIRSILASSQNAIEFKALSHRNGNTRRRPKITKDGFAQFKVKAVRQIGRSILSSIIPGDLSPLKSPVRSAAYRAITPGSGGRRRGGSLPGQNRAHRCPEGYQYGGRFTDNRFTTCGAQLFGIPSPLGAAIGAARRALTSGLPSLTTGRVATGADVDSSIIQSRAPQITRVGNTNSTASGSKVKDVVKEIGEYNTKWNEKVRRMVRRDGFVLEPVVPNKVLRAIPDNRDMEGAYFLMSALSASDMGGEELGLLSNTGVRSLVYVLPGGSTITLEKARKLEVGERRKLGRVVNSAQEINNSKDPGARLKNVASEIGDGLKYSENFTGINNPNSIDSGMPKWAKELWSKKLKSPKTEQVSTGEKEVSSRKKIIKNLEEATDYVSKGGTFDPIDPVTLSKLLTNSNLVQKQKLANNISSVVAGNNSFFLYESPKKMQHIGERFASELQQFLGMESPSVLFADKPGEKRKYLRQDVESAIPGGKFNPNIKIEQIEPADIARMMVSDFLTDQRERLTTSIYPIETPDGFRAVLAQNTTSGLVDLSKIEITQRMKMNIDDFYTNEKKPSYSEYYQALKAEQRILFMKLLSQMINRARSFNTKNFSDSMDKYGISEGEKIHINIVEKLFDSRLEVLGKQKDVLRTVIRGEKK
jgi:hypothetical protein